jgi:2'-5' RNA ligase
MQMYYIAIVLPPELNEKVLEWKNYMLRTYGCQVALKSPAHITLMPPFWMEDEKESSLISDMDRLAGSIEPFPAATDNFSSFPPRTLFIALKPNDRLAEVKKQADVFFRERNGYPMKFETRPYHPHITIANRDLYKKDFHEAWSHLQHKKFEEEWLANGLSLLRHNKKNWDVVHTSQFKNL